MEPVRITVSVAQVLREFTRDPAEPRYGYDLMRSLGFGSGKLYPILARLQRAGWLERLAPEENASSVSGGPPRVPYRLSPDAVAEARLELARLSSAVRPTGRRLKPRAAGGAT